MQVALVTVLITAFVTLAGMFTLLVFDAHPFSLSPVAKAHGRADFVFLVCKVVLVAVIDVWPLILGRWAVCAAAVLGGVLWAAAHIAFLPMYHHYMCGRGEGGRRVNGSVRCPAPPPLPLQEPHASSRHLCLYVGRPEPRSI